MTQRTKLLTTILLIVLLVGFVMILKNKDSVQFHSPASNNTSGEQTTGSAQETIRLVATGDMIAHDSINQHAQQPDGSYDYFSIMSAMKPIFDKADIRFCNQPTLSSGLEFGISGYPIFNAPTQFARDIEKVGCNLITIGSNHTFDKNQEVISATVATWDNRPKVLAVAGANRSLDEQLKPRIFTVKGLRFAFLSYTTYSNVSPKNNYGVNMYSNKLAKKQISQAKSQADFVIVSMRWGTEYSSQINLRQNQLAQEVADLGASLILGHGVHVLQPVKSIKTSDNRQVPVWFSLGNFLNAQLDIESLIGGFAVIDIDIQSKQVVDLRFLPTYQHYEWTTAEQQAQDLLKRKNFSMVTLDQATELLSRSLHNTSVDEQMSRVKALLNKYSKVNIISSIED